MEAMRKLVQSMLPGAARDGALENVLLVTDNPPCSNYSGGAFISEILRAIEFRTRNLFVVLNPSLKPDIPAEIAARVTMHIEDKPPELHFFEEVPLSAEEARQRELDGLRRVETEILPSLLKVAAAMSCDAFWMILEGQSMIRLAHRLMNVTSIPIRVQVMDPPDRWLRVHNVDAVSSDEVARKFAEVVARADSCATASWAMAAQYKKVFKARCTPIIPSVPEEWARPPATSLVDNSTIRIGFAGQVYAREEWDTLLLALSKSRWKIAGRPVEILAHAQYRQALDQSPDNHVKYYPWIDTKDLIVTLSEMDLLYCPYWFSAQEREDAELCFPSKLTTYLAAGRPVVFHGPSYSAPYKFLDRWNAAFLCRGPKPKHIREAIQQAVSDPSRYARTARNGSRAFHANLTQSRLRSSIETFLLGRTPFKWSALRGKRPSLRVGWDAVQFKPRVSIIVPVYNGAKYLRTALDSALGQSYQDIEVIVVNDGSTDETGEIVRSYEDRRLRYVEKANGGVASALNVGVGAMSGQYFCWLSHDDVFSRHKVRRQVEAYRQFRQRNDVILISDYKVIDAHGRLISEVSVDHALIVERPVRAVFRGLIHGCTVFLPRRVFAEIGIFDETLPYTQDYDFWLRALSNFRFFHMKHFLIKSRWHSDQSSKKGNYSEEFNSFWIKAMERLDDREKVVCDGSVAEFYRQMSTFLKSAGAEQAAIVAYKKMQGTLQSTDAMQKGEAT
jgi:glycosyltransferase involved in cell wall biosynthesis